MAIYIDANLVPDVDNISDSVFRYLIKKHKTRRVGLDNNYEYYLGHHKIMTSDPEDEDKIRVYSNYAKYVVDIGTGFYLGEPVKYNSNEEESNKERKRELSNGIHARINNGATKLYDFNANNRQIDIDALIDAYNDQTISECDVKIAKYIGIFGECYELEYASSDTVPTPRTSVIDPRNCIMVRDNTVEHNKLFAIVYDICEDLSEVKYYDVMVYTDHNSKHYRSRDLENFEFSQHEENEHFFGEVPVVEYQNNDERQGDYEQVIPLIDGLNELFSNRLTDKKKFVNSLLAMFGATIDEDSLKILKEEKYLDGIPTDARIEYIQKVFDEGSMTILSNDIIREIHKMTLTVDMTDENFAGNSSGQALMLKLMTMNILVKSKMRSFEKGLKKRFEMYNHWLFINGAMNIIDKKEVDIIFTISMPLDKAEILDTVVKLQGIVDNKTLLQQLWFIKDADKVIEALKEQKEEEQKQYLDAIGLQQKALDDNYSNNEDYDGE